jgi:DNA invertase Pin-like site-specific DNA recombinase
MVEPAATVTAVTDTATGLLRKLIRQLTDRPNPKRQLALGAIAWARVSTDEQQERGLSIPEQLRDMRAYAKSQGIEIVHEFHEVASAFRYEGRRVEFSKMLATARSDPRVTLILVHDFSRFSRDSARAKALVCELRTAGVQVISLNDPVVDAETPVGVYIEAITFAKNEAYSREIAFHTRKGCRANVQTRDPEIGWCYKNGTVPLWGYRAANVQRGTRKNRPVIKRIWELDDTVVSGRPVHEWVRHCLVELAGRGATQRELRYFCERNHLPRRRGGPWSSYAWRYLLGPTSLLQYCGYGVWDARRTGDHHLRPACEWLIVERAHPAILTPAEAQVIAVVAHGRGSRRGYGISRTTSSSQHLLTGGVFRCGNCGRNMVQSKRQRYVCSSYIRSVVEPCGQRLSVSRNGLDDRVIAGLSRVFEALSDSPGAVPIINRELADAWCRMASPGNLGETPGSARGLASRGVAVPELALSDRNPAGQDAGYSVMTRVQLDAHAVQASRRHTEALLSSGSPHERRRAIWAWLDRVEMDPERLRIDIAYRIPEEVTIPPGQGAWCAANSKTLRRLLAARWQIPKTAISLVRCARRPDVGSAVPDCAEVCLDATS